MDLELESPIFKDNAASNEEEEERTKTYKWYHINVDILPAKFAYVFEFVRLMCYTPNLVLFLTGTGLTKTESGIIMGFRSIGQLVGGPFWGIVADKWNCHKLVVVLICILSLITMCSQVLVALYHGDPNVNRCPASLDLMDNSNKSFPAIWNSFDKQNKTAIPNVRTGSTTDVSNAYLFWLILMLQIAVSFSESNATFIDAATLRKSELSIGRKVKYGRQRMFGAVGGTIGVVVGNLAVFNFPFSGVTCYAGFFIPYAIFAIATAVALEFLYKGLSSPKPLPKANSRQKSSNDLRNILFKTLSQKEIILFFGVTFLAGIFTTPRKFLYLYLKELNSPEALYTVSMLGAGITAFIGYCFSKEMINFFGSTWKAMAVSFIFYGLRHFGFSLIKNPWLIVLCEALHMLTYSLFLSAGVYHVKEVSPAPLITTMTAIYNAFFYAVGTMVGLPLCGFVYEKYGSRAMFRGASVINVISGVVIGILAVFVLNKKQQTNQNEDQKQNEDCLLESTLD